MAAALRDEPVQLLSLDAREHQTSTLLTLPVVFDGLTGPRQIRSRTGRPYSHIECRHADLGLAERPGASSR